MSRWPIVVYVLMETTSYLYFRWCLWGEIPRQRTAQPPRLFIDVLVRLGEMRRLFEIFTAAKTPPVLGFDQFTAFVADFRGGNPMPELMGCSSMHVTYKPIGLRLLRWLVQSVGGWGLYAHGFTRRVLPTGYRVWSRVVPGTPPILFFPGVGGGIAPYLWLLLSFGHRTIWAIEVPNMSGIATSSPHATPQSLRDVFRSLVPVGAPPVSVVAHSLGTLHVAMLINILPPHTIDTAVLLEPFCHPVHTSRATSLLFPSHSQESWWQFFARHLIGYDLGMQTFFYETTPYDLLLYQPEKCRAILNIVCASDTILSESYDDVLFGYLQQTHQDVQSVPGDHGASIARKHITRVAAFLAEHAA